MSRKLKKKTWWQLKDNKCPNCLTELQKGMFEDPYVACPHCGFTVTDATKDLLVERDHTPEPEV